MKWVRIEEPSKKTLVEFPTRLWLLLGQRSHPLTSSCFVTKLTLKQLELVVNPLT